MNPEFTESKYRPVHELKTWQPYYRDVKNKLKKFELRYNDRNFKVGDLLCLKEYNPDTKEYTGEECFALITYILTGFTGIEPGYVILSINLVEDIQS